MFFFSFLHFRYKYEVVTIVSEYVFNTFRPPLSLLWSQSNVVVAVIVSVRFLPNRVAVLTFAGEKGAVVDGDAPQTPVYLLTTVAMCTFLNACISLVRDQTWVCAWGRVARTDEPVHFSELHPPPSLSSINPLRLLDNPLTLMLKHVNGKMHRTLFLTCLHTLLPSWCSKTNNGPTQERFLGCLFFNFVSLSFGFLGGL